MIRLVSTFLLAACVLATTAVASGDPRKCARSSPAQCASAAATKAALAKVKVIAPQARPPLIPTCTAQGTANLRWRCGINDGGGHGWTITVTFKPTSRGWRTYATVVASR